MDARTLDPRLRGPVEPIETEIDPRTGMKNYIANESGGWATSAGYLRFSIGRCIHFGRLYTSGSGRSSGREEDLNEALRCLGQALHTLVISSCRRGDECPGADSITGGFPCPQQLLRACAA